MVCPAVSTPHRPGNKDVLPVPLPRYTVVDHVGVLRPWMCPGALVNVLQLKCRVCYKNLILSAEG